MPRVFQIGASRIGPGQRCYVIAEAGVNHNGDAAIARALVDAAADAGADAIKFQTFDPSALAHPDAERAAYQQRNLREEGTQLSMLEKLVLPRAAHADLRSYAAARNLEFLSTPFDRGSADFLAGLGVPAFKISSGDLGNALLSRHVAHLQRPILLSTGMATLDDVRSALDAIREVSPVPVAVLHCVSAYPSDPADSNLRVLAVMAAALDVPVGFSDHTATSTTALAAVALGAAVIEKHLTLDRTMTGPDHAASAEPAAFAQLVRDIRAVESALGDGVKRPVPAEADAARVVQRSLHWARALTTGQTVTEEDLLALRPGGGIAPADWRTLVGRTLRRAVAAHDPVRRDDVS